MSNAPESSEEQQPKPKKLNLSDFLPAKAVVETSLGTLYVRHAHTSDWKHFESNNARELGKAAVRHLSSRIEDKNDSEQLADEDFEALDDADFQALVPVIAMQSGWGAMSTGAGLQQLGDSVKAAKTRARERHKEMLADMRKSISSNYGFLEKNALEKLQEQMAGLSSIRSSMPDADALKAAIWPSTLTADTLKSAIEKTTRGIDPLAMVTGLNETPSQRHPQMPILHLPEETKLGRAALESAENSRETAQKMYALVDLITELNQTMVKDVLPAWGEQVKANQQGAKEAFDQAANGLWWTKWAVITSVVVTILTAWWQVSVTRGIDQENTQQQRRVEVLLDKQLVAQQKLIEQQTRDAAAMRETIASLKSLSLVAAPKK